MKIRFQIRWAGKWYYTYANSKSQAYQFIKARVANGDKGSDVPYKGYKK